MIVIAKAIQTSIACPSQWDAWGDDGKYYYLRYRHGVGYVRHYPGGPNFWERLDEEGQIVAWFEDDIPEGEPDGHIELEEFVEKVEFRLCKNLNHKHFNEYLADHLASALKETYPDEWEARYGNKEPQL